MVPFFVQFKCKLGQSYVVANALAEAEIASEIYSTAGDYDLLVKFYVDNDTDIGHFVNEKVQVHSRHPGHPHHHHLQGVRFEVAAVANRVLGSLVQRSLGTLLPTGWPHTAPRATPVVARPRASKTRDALSEERRAAQLSGERHSFFAAAADRPPAAAT